MHIVARRLPFSPHQPESHLLREISGSLIRSSTRHMCHARCRAGRGGMSKTDVVPTCGRAAWMGPAPAAERPCSGEAQRRDRRVTGSVVGRVLLRDRELALAPHEGLGTPSYRSLPHRSTRVALTRATWPHRRRVEAFWVVTTEAPSVEAGLLLPQGGAQQTMAVYPVWPRSVGKHPASHPLQAPSSPGLGRCQGHRRTRSHVAGPATRRGSS